MSVVFSTRARWRGKRPLLALLQGLFTVALTLLGLLLITFALSALSPVDRVLQIVGDHASQSTYCLLYTSPSPRDLSTSRMPSSA